MRALLVVSILAACGGTTKGTTPSLSKDDAVYEAVFLHEISKANVTSDETICLKTRGSTNDGSALLTAIKARHAKAVLDVECSGGGPSGPVVHSGSGGSAVRFDIGPVTWVDDATATIDGGGGHRGGATAHEVKYTVKQDGGDWKVVDEKPGLTI